MLAKTLIASHRQVATIISSWTSCSVLEVSALCGAKCARCADCGVVFKRYIDSEECSEIMALGIVYQGYSDTCLSLLYMNCMHIYTYICIYIYAQFIARADEVRVWYIMHIYIAIWLSCLNSENEAGLDLRAFKACATSEKQLFGLQKVALVFPSGGLQPNWQISRVQNRPVINQRVFLVSMTCLSYIANWVSARWWLKHTPKLILYKMPMLCSTSETTAVPGPIALRTSEDWLAGFNSVYQLIEIRTLQSSLKFYQ